MSNVHDTTPVPAISPQFPLVLLVDDGMTYIYGSGCCDQGSNNPPGNHPGMIFSEQELNLGCNGSSVDEANQEPVPKGDLDNQGNESLSLAPTDTINNGSNEQIFRNNFQLASYYGNGPDAIKLKGTNDRTRWFTLARAEYKTDENCQAEFSFPILVQSRTTAPIILDDGTLRTPVTNQDLTSDPVGFDFEDEATPYGIVRLVNLADPSNAGSTITIECLLVNRTI